MAVVKEDGIGREVVADRDVEIAVAVEIREFGGVAGGKVPP